MFMRYRRIFSSIPLLLAAASLILPVMSIYCRDYESGTVVVRLFDLPEFGIAGFFALTAPAVLFLLSVLPMSGKVRTVIAGIFFIAYTACFAAALKAAYSWLAEIGTDSFRYYPVCLTYILLILAAVILIILPAGGKKSACSSDS